MRQAFFTPNSILRSRQPRDSVFSRGSEDAGTQNGLGILAVCSIWAMIAAINCWLPGRKWGVLWSSQLSGGIRLLWENQCVLKSIGPGADHVPRHREILTDVEVELNAVGPLGIIGDGVGVTGHLLAAAGL